MSAALFGTGTTGGGVTSAGGSFGLGPGEYASLQGGYTGGEGLPLLLLSGEYPSLSMYRATKGSRLLHSDPLPFELTGL